MSEAVSDRTLAEVRRVLRPGGALYLTTPNYASLSLRLLEHTGLLPAFASVHGATMDGLVRHKDQVVGAALAAHPGGRDPAPQHVAGHLHET